MVDGGTGQLQRNRVSNPLLLECVSSDLPLVGAVLLLHGSKPNSASDMRPLANVLAAQGFVCLIPQLSTDGGFAATASALKTAERLVASIAGPKPAVVVGWSRGARLAVDFVAHTPEAFVAVVAVCGDFTKQSVFGAGAVKDVGSLLANVKIGLACSERDEVVDASSTHEFADSLARLAIDVRVIECGGGHGDLVGLGYDGVDSYWSPAGPSGALVTLICDLATI